MHLREPTSKGEGDGREREGRVGQGRKGKGKEGKDKTGAPFNFLPPGAADVVTPLSIVKLTDHR